MPPVFIETLAFFVFATTVLPLAPAFFFFLAVVALSDLDKLLAFAAGKAWAKRTFDTYPSAYANMAASKYCKDPNYAKGSKKRKKKAKGGFVSIRGQGAVMSNRLR